MSENSARSRENDWIWLPLSICVCSTVLESRISWRVTSRLSCAAPMKTAEESRIVAISGPASSKAMPSSVTTVRRSSVPTEATNALTSVSSVVVSIGTRVSSTPIDVPDLRYGPADVRGWRSMYCSPIADLLATTASRSAEMFGALFSMSRRARTPSSVKVSLPTLPTAMPRYVTSAPAKMPPDSSRSAVTL